MVPWYSPLHTHTHAQTATLPEAADTRQLRPLEAATGRPQPHDPLRGKSTSRSRRKAAAGCVRPSPEPAASERAPRRGHPARRKGRPAEAAALAQAAGEGRSPALPELGASLPPSPSGAGSGAGGSGTRGARSPHSPRPSSPSLRGGRRGEARGAASPAAAAPVTGRPSTRVPQGKSSGRRRGRAHTPLVAAAAASH